MLSSDQILSAEIALALAVLAATRLWPSPAARFLARALRAGRRFFRTPARLAVCAALFSLAISATFARFVHWPVPRVHDEFSYLLSADTFLHARLSNPPPRVSAPFETYHVLIEPTYASKYPTGQGLALAAGKALTGEALGGVWMSSAALAAGLAWMCWAWLGRTWAVPATALGTLYLCGLCYWAQSYWGGTLAALGGTLVFGALPRLTRRAANEPALVFGLGLALWMVTRPFEGLVAALPALLWFAQSAARRGGKALCVRALLAALAPLAAGVWILLNNRAVTGSYWELPYFVYDRRYAVAPPFLWGRLAGDPQYLTEPVRAYWTGFAREVFERQSDLAGWLGGVLAKTRGFLRFYGSPIMLGCLLGLWHARRQRRVAFALTTGALLWFSSLSWTYNLPHYSAPIAALALVLLFAALRQTRRGQAGFPARGTLRGAALCAYTLLALACAAGLRSAQARDVDWPDWRARLERELAALQQPSLVLVSYGERHSVHDEWVYNGADLDTTRVRGARDLGEASNRAVIESYPGRRVWRVHLEVDRAPVVRGP